MTAWRPILDEPDRTRALAIVSEIGAAFRAPPAEATGTLYGGLAGIALLHAYLEHDELACQLLAESVQRLGDPIQAGVAWGVAGIAWVTEHLRQRGLPVEVDETLDEYLASCVAETPWDHPYDLMEGLAGIALAVLARARDPLPAQIVSNVIARLEEIALARPTGITFAYQQPQNRGLGFPVGTQLGPSHGITGVIGVLARYVERDIEAARARRLLDALVAWMFAERLPAGDVAVFPSSISGELVQKGASGWCHGDIGISTVLLACSSRMQNAPWREVALDTMRTAARRRLRSAALPDVTLCHGTIGVAHMLNRGFHGSGDLELRDAARALYAQTIERWTEANAEPIVLLEGPIGLALGLLAAASEIEPGWDEIFLMS